MKHHSLQDLLTELQALARGEDELQRDIRKQARSTARQLWLELEEPGDIVTRVIFQVKHLAPRARKLPLADLL